METRDRTKEIDDFCLKLAKMWKKEPSLRFGQLIYEALGNNIKYAEDIYAMKALEDYFDLGDDGNIKLGKILQTLDNNKNK